MLLHLRLQQIGRAATCLFESEASAFSVVPLYNPPHNRPLNCCNGQMNQGTEQRQAVSMCPCCSNIASLCSHYSKPVTGILGTHGDFPWHLGEGSQHPIQSCVSDRSFMFSLTAKMPASLLPWLGHGRQRCQFRAGCCPEFHLNLHKPFAIRCQ